MVNVDRGRLGLVTAIVLAVVVVQPLAKRLPPSVRQPLVVGPGPNIPCYKPPSTRCTPVEEKTWTQVKKLYK